MELNEAIRIMEIVDKGKHRDKIERFKFAQTIMTVSGDKEAIRRVLLNKVMEKMMPGHVMMKKTKNVRNDKRIEQLLMNKMI